MLDDDFLNRVCEDVLCSARRYFRSNNFLGADVEEMAQQCILRTFRNVRTDRIDELLSKHETELRRYTFTVARNILLERYRQKRWNSLAEAETTREPSTGDTEAQVVRKDLVQKALQELSEDELSVYDVWVDGETEEEGAKRLRISVAAVKIKRMRVKVKVVDAVRRLSNRGVRDE